MNIEDKITQWQDANLTPELKKQLDNYSKDELHDAFYQDLSFGTAGMRGILGAGTNRMNIYTVAQTTQALATVIKHAGEDAEKRGVVISFDSRINSDLFAQTAAQVLRANDITVYLFDKPRPTPELSYAVLQYETFAGIMITASHNPKEYNGYKLYGEDGGQLPPKPAAAIVKERENIKDIFNIVQKSAGIKKVPASFDKKYLNEVKNVTIDATQAKKAKEFKVAFTPLHGAGGEIGFQALKNAGFKNAKVVESQFEPDGQFPTLKFPNPEYHEVFEVAQKNFADFDLLIGVDPDADRMGLSYRDSEGEWKYLTGNQIAVLFTKYILEAKKTSNTLPKNGVIITSNVSSNLPAQIAKSYKIKTIEVLTGFKYIADKIVQFDKTKKSEFLLGFEESYGYLIKPFAHDKDSIQATVLMAELAAYYYNQGKTLGDALDDLYEEFGYVIEDTRSVNFPGESGLAEMQKLMTKFRSKAPKTIGKIAIDSVSDYQLRLTKIINIKSKDYGKTTKITLPEANVIKYWLEDGSWVALRPSGTEPKLKIYVGVVGSDIDDAQNKLGLIEGNLDSLAGIK